MNKPLRSSFLVLCLSQLLSAQQTFDEVLITPFWGFYSENNLSAVSDGRGVTGVASKNDIAGILLNPASLDVYKKYQVHAAVVYKSNVPWLTSLGESDLSLKELHPTIFVAGGYRVNEIIQTGFAYCNNTGFMLDLGTIIETNEFGEEIGRFDADERFNVHSFTVPFVVNYDIVSLGVNATYSLFSGRLNFASPIGGRSSFGRFIPQAGFQIKPFNIFSFGAAFSPGFTQSIEWKFDDGRTETSNLQSFPMKLTAGVELMLKYFVLNLDYNFANTSVDKRLRDRHDFHFGMEFPVNEMWIVRGGIYTLKDYRSNEVNWLDPIGSYNQTYMTIGGSVKIKNS
jgi:hypothetical protein